MSIFNGTFFYMIIQYPFSILFMFRSIFYKGCGWIQISNTASEKVKSLLQNLFNRLERKVCRDNTLGSLMSWKWTCRIWACTTNLVSISRLLQMEIHSQNVHSWPKLSLYKKKRIIQLTCHWCEQMFRIELGRPKFKSTYNHENVFSISQINFTEWLLRKTGGWSAICSILLWALSGKTYNK